MGIALLTFVDLWMPLQSLANRWLPARPARRNDESLCASELRYVSVRPSRAARGDGAPNAFPATPVAQAPSRPLRVVRLVDRQQGGARHSNRVVISGRMADVCAELDRLAALEALEAPAGAARPAHLH
jgi:hypothetical protein